MKKKYFILYILIFIILNLFSQNRQDDFIPKKNNSNFIAPSGTIKLNDSLFIDISLVDNVMYHEFLDRLQTFWSLKAHDSIKRFPKFGLNKKEFDTSNIWHWTDLVLYISMLPKDNLSVGEKIIMKTFFHHPKYNYYPIVNISRKQADMYCKWRTDMVMILWAIKSENKDQRKKYPNNIKYRLPTVNELNSAIEVFGYSEKKKKSFKEIPFLTYRLNYKFPYRKSIFLKNNISEYTLDSLSFGSNWRKKKAIEKANDYTGFRCVCEIVE